MSTFYVVATPIGNLKDITLRAIEVLGSVETVLCEDTRVTRKLLEHYNIKTETLSYHAHSKLSRVDEIIVMLREGKNLALVSDAGTPAISDPGSALVARIREEMAPEIASGELKVEVIAGPSALVAALSVAGIPCAEFVFLGFLPHKKGRETLFKEIASSERTCVFYESPHRILKSLESLKEHATFKKVTVCRELTKIYEEVVSGSPVYVLEYFKQNSDKVRGEFVVIVSL